MKTSAAKLHQRRECKEGCWYCATYGDWRKPPPAPKKLSPRASLALATILATVKVPG